MSDVATEEEVEPFESTAAPLYSFDRPWDESSGIVLVCLDPTDGIGHDVLVRKAISVLDKTWASATNVIFAGWNACDYARTYSGPTAMVAVHFLPGTAGLTPGPMPGGQRPDGSWSPEIWRVDLISDDPDAFLQRFRYQVVHEFGHVLGFGHEQSRPDSFVGTVRTCPDGMMVDGTSESGGTYRTASYDPDSVMNYCSREPLDPSGMAGTAPFRTVLSAGDITGARQIYGGPRAHGFMITSDTNRGLVVNAWGGAQEGTRLRLHNGCAVNNPDCTFSYQNGMLLSDRDPSLAINAWFGAREGAELVLTRLCTPTNPDCLWTYKNGMFVSDRNPALAINATGGAAFGTALNLTAACNTSNRDCTWTMDHVMLSSARDRTVSINAWGGATNNGPLRLHEACKQNNPDCTFTISGGLLLSSRNTNLAVSVSGAVSHLATLVLREGCDKWNPACTWTFTRGAIVSDANPSLSVNALYGGAHGATLALHNACNANNRDCVFPAHFAR